MKIIRRMMSVLALALVVTGYHASATQGREMKIGVANFTLCCAYFIGMDQAIKDEAKVYPNITLISTDAKGDAGKLTTDVETMLAQKVDGIIISGGPLEAAPAALDSIKKAGIPVVLVDRLLKGGDFTSWIGPDNYLIGTELGDYIVKRTGGKGLVVVIRGGPADNSIGLDRTNGMLSVVGKTGMTVEKAPDFGGWSEDGGFKVMEGMLTRFKKIDVVFCENDSMCEGAQKAIKDAGRSNEMFLNAIDGEKAALKEIMQPDTNYAATGRNNSDQIGRAAFHRLTAILAGADAPKKTVLPSPLITRDNAVKFYDPNSVF